VSDFDQNAADLPGILPRIIERMRRREPSLARIIDTLQERGGAQHAGGALIRQEGERTSQDKELIDA